MATIINAGNGVVASSGDPEKMQVRNISFGTTEKTSGEASSEPEGSMYFSYE